jgi:hypothetical protein
MTAPASQSSVLGNLRRNPLTRVMAYYALLAVGLLLLEWYAPAFSEALRIGEEAHGGPPPTDIEQLTRPQAPPDPGPFGIGFTTLLGMAATFVLMLPVVWVYQFTRRKRGYQQSLVQTLIILPIVVAATVSLVRSSIALAFALGGIVGAVAFRHRLEDTKDAVYVFLAIAIGLACGVQVLPVALSLSVFFNLVILILWYTDFGRVPAVMGGSVGQRRVELARELAVAEGTKDTSEFISVVDEQILQSMTPSQLAALAAKAMERQHKMAEHLDDAEKQLEGVLAVTLAGGASEEGLRRSVEQALERETKEWRLDDASHDAEGRIRFRYRVRFKKTVPKALVLETVRRATIGQADKVGFE